MPLRDSKGKFVRKDGQQFGTYVDEKGYPRISAGPFTGVRVHTLVAQAMLKRDLLPTEDVDHDDGNKLNCHWTNLKVIDHTAHGYKSAAQAQFMKRKDEYERQQFEEHEAEVVSFDPAKLGDA
jgi:hypothetical protein